MLSMTEAAGTTAETTQQTQTAAAATQTTPTTPSVTTPSVFQARDVNVFYNDFRAVKNVSFDVPANRIMALIGPSGCGKSTVLRCFNRMNDLIKTAHVTGSITYYGTDIYESHVDPVEVRRRIGMVFQKPNPFPKSIFDNIAYGPRLTGKRKGLDDLVENSLRKAALWSEVKDRLQDSALGLSGGQQQRLCIARALAVNPDVLLMDEPCSALDPIATARIEDLMQQIKQEYTILIVTHNMQQAARVSDTTAFFTTDVDSETDNDKRSGMLVEIGSTSMIFSNPKDERTENYVTGRFG